ncbi:MAG: glycosyltransferase [Patescibacteria group bacterium]|nr:glycosyltransferase [Patescibacteria group bacterium]
MQPKTIVVIIAFNSDLDRVRASLKIFRAQLDGVVISDNSTKLEIRKELKTLAAEYPGFVTYIGNKENMGIGAALNVGVREAIGRGAEWVMTIEDDNAPESDMVKIMFAAYYALPPEQQTKIGSIAPNYTRLNGFAFPDGEPQINYDGAITSGEVVKASIYPIVGWYDENLFIDFVDGEFSCRVQQHGFATLLVPRAILKHRLGFPTLKKLFGRTIYVPNYPPFRYYFMMRNAIYLYVRHFNTYIIHNNHRKDAIWSVLVPRFLIKAVLLEEHKGLKLKMACKGWWDGIRGKMDRAYARTRAGLPDVPTEVL